jgi:hypothetical protein
MVTAVVAGAEPCFGWQRAAKVSMMIVPPQQRQLGGTRCRFKHNFFVIYSRKQLGIDFREQIGYIPSLRCPATRA